MASAALLASPALTETYRLVHVIGNAEQMGARNLSSSECDKRKTEYTEVAERLGTYNERSGHGSIVCFPESMFAD